MSCSHTKMCRWQVFALPLLFLSSFLLVYREEMSLVALRQDRLNGTRLASSSTSSMYELAKYESFGFFDNIDNETWQLHKDRAQREPIYMLPGTPDAGASNKPLWLLINVDPMFTCPNLRRVGGRGDGPKWTCDPHRLVTQPDCLIYSIGSNGIYRFEDGMVSILKHHSSSGDESGLPNCEFHVFDPNPRFIRKDDAETKNIHYHPWGLKSSYEPFNRGKFPESFEFLSFAEIQERLGHENRRVDIFKIDCEGCELTSYEDWLNPSANIRQVLVETHSIPEAPSQFFNRFFDMGFVPFSKEANTHPGAKPTGQLFEWGWIRLHPDFLNSKTSLVHSSSTE